MAVSMLRLSRPSSQSKVIASHTYGGSMEELHSFRNPGAPQPHYLLDGVSHIIECNCFKNWDFRWIPSWQRFELAGWLSHISLLWPSSYSGVFGPKFVPKLMSPMLCLDNGVDKISEKEWGIATHRIKFKWSTSKWWYRPFCVRFSTVSSNMRVRCFDSWLKKFLHWEDVAKHS